MGIKVFYVFGALNPDGSPSFYDDESVLPTGNRYKIFVCDTLNDLIGQLGDLAIVKDSNQFFFGEGSQWNEVAGGQGLQGEPGPQGIQGLPGNDGSPGAQGQQGSKGDTGDQGQQGIQGTQGLPGADGSQGLQGIQGEQGFPGSKGDKGDTGDTGSQGIQGSPGAKGDTGDQGIQGSQGQQGIQGIQGPQGNPGVDGVSNYTIPIQALTSSPADGATVYFGMLPKAPTTTVNISKVYIRKAGTIKGAEIYCYSGTAGTNEVWSLYIRKNNTTDTLIATLSVNTNERVFTNASLSIAVSVGDYIEIKGVQPTWVTNPLTTIYGGYIYIE